MISLRQACLLKIRVDYVKQVGRFSENHFHCSTSARLPVCGLTLVETAKRTLTTGHASRVQAVSIRQNTFSKEDHDEFMRYFPEFVDVLTSEEPCVKVPKFKERLSDVLKYNVNLVNNARGIATVFSYKAFERIVNLSEENIKLAVMLGWCVRMNDYEDCYGNPEDTGKIGTDIRECKFSWLAMKAFQKGSSDQRMLLQNNYGRDNEVISNRSQSV